jgi:hypothetical protein
MAGLVPAIHVFAALKEDVDAGTRPGMTGRTKYANKQETMR